MSEDKIGISKIYFTELPKGRFRNAITTIRNRLLNSRLRLSRRIDLLSNSRPQK